MRVWQAERVDKLGGGVGAGWGLTTLDVCASPVLVVADAIRADPETYSEVFLECVCEFSSDLSCMRRMLTDDW